MKLARKSTNKLNAKRGLRFHFVGFALTAACGSCVLQACQYERVVSRSSILSRLEDSADNDGISRKPTGQTIPDVLRTPEDGIRKEHEDGSITLYAKSIRQLMTHITNTIQNNERELFVEQVLSQRTKDEFLERELDPGLAFDELVRRQRDIFRMFYFMPMGEYTPGLFVQPIGRNTFRLQLSRARNEDLNWIGIDAVFEGQNYRLRWFVPQNQK